MRIKVVTVGKTRTGYWRQAAEDYAARVARYVKLEQRFAREARLDSLKNEALVKQAEAVELRKHIADGEFLIALDPQGKQLSSERLAEFFRQQTLHNSNRFCFAIGGSLGLAADLLGSAKLVLSLSPMTFPHEMARVVLLEQLYRALTIMNGEQYHK